MIVTQLFKNFTLLKYLFNFMSSPKAKLLSAKEPHFFKKTQPSEQKSVHSAEEHHPTKNSEMRELLEMFRDFLGRVPSNLHNQTTLSSANECQPRDREVEITLPTEKGESLRSQTLQSFVTLLCRTVWSRGFHYYSTDQLSLEHAKAYCSQQILRNFVRLGSKFRLSGQHFGVINSQAGRVLDYMLTKYPMTLSQDVNRSVNSAVREIDNTDQLTNDYVYTSPVVFHYRQSGEYSDLVMHMLNEVLRRLNLRVGSRTIYEKFEDKMGRLFENVMEMQWMREGQDDRGADFGIRDRAESKQAMELQAEIEKMKQDEEEKYRAKVQQYTSYKISRKVPQSTPPFSEEEISSRNIRIDNPHVLRLLTKWCQELQRKFTTPNYFAHYIETLKLEDGKYVSEVPDEIKECLDQLMAEEHRSIKEELRELAHNNHYLQGELLLRQLNRPGRSQLERLECISARYSADMVHNLHAYIIAYLNRLIHGLLTVALKFGKSRSVKAAQWSSNLNLVTFQVMDLLRCRCATGQKEVLRLYHELLRMSQGQNMKMVRVINRLRRGTNDILINIKYRDILCEVQLAVTKTNNKFIEYSNTFNHYFYELRRSFFGPITELCSIWKSIDPRFSYYDRTRPLPPPVSKHHTCQSDRDFEVFNRPFICCECGNHLFHNNYIRHHLKCRRCNYWLCAKCQIESTDPKALLAAAFKNEELVRSCTRLNPSQPIPQFGICVFLQSQQLKVEPFRKHTDKDCTRLIGIKNRKLYEIVDISNNDSESTFRRRFMIFEVGQSFGRRHIKIEDEKIREFCLQQAVKRIFGQNKERFCLNYAGLTNDLLGRLAILGSITQKANIKKVEVIGNKIDSVAPITHEFKNIRYLQLSKNKITNFTGLEKLQKLQKLFANQNHLREVPLAIVNLWNLKELSLTWNDIKALPAELAKLHRLRILKLANNKIDRFDACLSQLFYLNELSLKNNLLTVIPEEIKSLNELTSLQLQNNLITDIHPNIGCLYSLQSINISGNHLSTLPDAFQSLKNLTSLKVCHNRLQRVPASLSTLSSIQCLDISNNQISQLPSFARLHQLTDLNLSYNILNELPELPQSQSNLKILTLSHNGIRQVPSLASSPNLEELYLNNNSIESVHEAIAKAEKLQILRLQHNNLAKIPELRIESLKTLNISQNKLTSFCTMDLISLQELDLSGNFINSFANNLLPYLKRINLANNKLETAELAGLLNLRYVHLSYNQLKSVPRFSDGSHIKVLSLQHNHIETIPPSVTLLHNLSVLNLSHNSIILLPKQLQAIQGLKEKGLDISHNPIQKVDCWDFMMRKATKSTIQNLEKTLPFIKSSKVLKEGSNSSHSSDSIRGTM